MLECRMVGFVRQVSGQYIGWRMRCIVWVQSLIHYNDVIMSLSNHQPHHCLLNRLFGRRSKKTSKLRVTGLCAGNSPGTGEFPAQMASNAEMFPFDDVIMLCSTMGIAPCWIIELGRVIPKAHWTDFVRPYYFRWCTYVGVVDIGRVFIYDWNYWYYDQW